MVAIDPCRLVLEKYQAVSKEVEIRCGLTISSLGGRVIFHRLTTAGRELMSRCILSDDDRGFIFLLAELEILTNVLGQTEAAEHIHLAAEHLARVILGHNDDDEYFTL